MDVKILITNNKIHRRAIKKSKQLSIKYKIYSGATEKKLNSYLTIKIINNKLKYDIYRRPT